MSSIKNIASVSSDVSKLNKNKSVKESKGGQENKKSTAVHSTASRDQAQISSAGRELLALKQEAEKYIDDIKQAEVLSTDEVAKIKEKLESKYYLQPEVIDTIVDKLTQLPQLVKGNTFNQE